MNTGQLLSMKWELELDNYRNIEQTPFDSIRNELYFVKFMQKVNICQDCDCWHWSGSRNNHALFSMGSKTPVMAAHFILFHTGRRRLKGHVVWRACGDTLCVNPGHLHWQKPGRIMTRAYNLRRDNHERLSEQQ